MDRERQIEKLIASCDLNLGESSVGDSGDSKEGFDLASANALDAMRLAELVTQTAKEMFDFIGSLSEYLSESMSKTNLERFHLFTESREAFKKISALIDLATTHMHRVAAVQSGSSDFLTLLLQQIQKIVGSMSEPTQKTDHLMDILPRCFNDSVEEIGAESEASKLANEALNILRELTGIVGTIKQQIIQMPFAIAGVSCQQLACIGQEFQRGVGILTSTETEEHEH